MYLALTSLVALAPVGTLVAEDLPENLQEGWDGSVQLGALATFGVTDTSAISARSEFTYRGARFEQELNAKYYRSASEALVTRFNEQGEELTDNNGVAVKDLVRNTTNDRRFVSAQPRWFFSSKHYLFALADLEINKPADIDSSSRQIAGAGYRLYRTQKDFLSAAFGIGRKELSQVSGESESDAIGYFALRFKRAMSDAVALSIDLDSDFGAGNRFSELEATLSWKLRDPLSLKLKYEARVNSNIVNSLDSFDDEVEAALSVNLAMDVF